MKFTMQVKQNQPSDAPGGMQVKAFVVPEPANDRLFVSAQNVSLALYDVAPDIAALFPEGAMLSIDVTVVPL